MLTNRTLTRINNRPREVPRLPLLAAGGGVLVLGALLYVFGILPLFAFLGVLGGDVVLVLLLYVSQKAKTTISLSYGGNLDDQTASRFFEVRESLEELSRSEGIWCLPPPSKPPNKGEVAPVPERVPASVGLLPTPGIKSDVPIWGIEAGEGSIFFFPEGILYYKNDRYEPVSYKALTMAVSSGRYFEEEDLPKDAAVVDSTWRFSRPDGSPDPRHGRDNVEIPVVLYALLDIDGPGGLGMRLMVSNRRATVRFALAFGAEDSRKLPRDGSFAGTASGKTSKRPSSDGQKDHREKHRSAEDLEREARLAAARRTLGTAKGASAEQIGAAYRKLALAHHPDRVANLEPEVREYSERRMKEINAAYAELKRERNDRTSEKKRTG
jgi:hypothetical protein